MKRIAHFILFALTACGSGGSGDDSPAAQTDSRSALAIPRIVNGSPKGENFPEVNQIFVRLPAGGSVTCSGSWIGTRKLLTAAHCVTDSSGRVAAKNSVTALVSVNGTTSAWRSTAVAVHPQYVSGRVIPSSAYPRIGANAYDFAVVSFAQSFPAPAAVLTNRPPQTGKQLIIVGYGTQGGNSTTTGVGLLGFTKLEKLDPYRLFWKFDGGGESNTCFGDSGGPAYIDWGYGPRLVGVTSGGTSANCAPGDISFDSRIDTALDWLRQVTGGDMAYDEYNTTAASSSAGSKPTATKKPSKPKKPGKNRQ